MGNHVPPKTFKPLSHLEVSWAVPSLIFNLFAADGIALGPMPPLPSPRSGAGTWHGCAPLASSNTLIPFPAPPQTPKPLPIPHSLPGEAVRIPGPGAASLHGIPHHPPCNQLHLNKFHLNRNWGPVPLLRLRWFGKDLWGGRRLSPCATLQLARLPAAHLFSVWGGLACTPQPIRKTLRMVLC